MSSPCSKTTASPSSQPPGSNCSTPIPPRRTPRAQENRTVDNPRTPNRRTADPATLSGPTGPQGRAALQAGDDHRSQDDRHDVCRRLFRVIWVEIAVTAIRPAADRAVLAAQRIYFQEDPVE